MLEASGLPIGFSAEEVDFSQQSVILDPGDRLLIYSDGVPDTMSDSGEVYGAARMLESITRLHQVPLSEMVNSLMAEISEWRGEAAANDDASILAVEVK